MTLMLSTLGKIFSTQQIEIFSNFLKKTGFDIHANCLQRRILLSGKNKKNINLSSAEFAKRVVKINYNSQTAMAQTSLGPWNFGLDMGSFSH